MTETDICHLNPEYRADHHFELPSCGNLSTLEMLCNNDKQTLLPIIEWKKKNKEDVVNFYHIFCSYIYIL